MPTIFDNITTPLVDGLRKALPGATAASFCVGYLNLRGWGQLADLVDTLPGNDESRACRLLVGMHRPPEEDMKAMASLKRPGLALDGPTIARLRRRITERFKQQLEFGVPTTEAETALRRLAAQLRARKVFLKAFLRYPLHAKLYLIERADPVAPLIGFVGSSNLTLAGLSHQGELNVDVVEQDAAQKLRDWFNERWQDEWTLDLTDELATLIETSWARTELVRPYLVYLKIASHLCEEARQGEREFRLPKLFRGVLMDFQEAAVSLAAHYLHRRGGVLLGDVVGLGKTLMATAVARVLQEDDDGNTLVLCPPKLRPMWERHLEKYQITGRVLSLGRVIDELPNLPRYRLLIIDESHNLRNRQGRRYRAIRDYIDLNEPRVLLLSATPYSKQFTDPTIGASVSARNDNCSKKAANPSRRTTMEGRLPRRPMEGRLPRRPLERPLEGRVPPRPRLPPRPLARVEPGPPTNFRPRVGVEPDPPHRLMEGCLPRRPMEGRLPRRPMARVTGPSKTSQSGRGGTGASIRSGYRGGVVLEVSKFAGR